MFQPTAPDLAAMGLNPMKMMRAGKVARTVSASVRARLEASPSLVEALSS